MNTLFSLNDSIYQLVEKQPKALDFLVANGFNNLANPALYAEMSKKISLNSALKMQNKDEKLFCQQLEEFLLRELTGEDKSLIAKSKEQKADLEISGVLPCPIKIPLMAEFEEWQKTQPNLSIKEDLKSANLGNFSVDKLEKQSKDLPDLILSAGFELFLNHNVMKQFQLSSQHQEFRIQPIDFTDPMNIYHIIGIIPAVFLIDQTVLGKRKIPRTWADLFADELINSVALPLSDLDLFNALIANIYKEYGDEGIDKLAAAYQKSLHPSEMLKSKQNKSADKPAVSIIPYFFAKMNRDNHLLCIWPEDGAIVSPIFWLGKKEKEAQLDAVFNFFSSVKVGELLASNNFPSTNPKLKHNLTAEQKIKWPGWDFIHHHDFNRLLETNQQLFHQKILGDQFEVYDKDLLI